MTIAQAFNEITIAQGGTPSKGGTITGAIDALNDTLAGSDQKPAQTIEGAIRLLGAHIGGGVAPSGTISITENGEGIDVAQYAYADVNVSGGGVSLGDLQMVMSPNDPLATTLDASATQVLSYLTPHIQEGVFFIAAGTYIALPDTNIPAIYDQDGLVRNLTAAGSGSIAIMGSPMPVQTYLIEPLEMGQQIRIVANND